MLTALKIHGKRAGGLARDKSGSVALEFALIAMPFFTLMMAIFETTAVYYTSATLENAVNDAARTIRTGETQSNGASASDFHDLICERINALLKCDGSLVVDVRSFNQFDDVNFPPALDANGNLNANEQFSPGGPGDIVLVRVFYTWRIATPVIGESLSNMSGSYRLVSATTAFRNEPFGSLLP